MRIVDVNPYFYPWLGGIEHRMHRIAKELVKRGHEVTIITGRLPDTNEDEMTEYGYRVIRLPSKLYNLYQPPYISSKGLIEKLNELKPDIVNYNYRWAFSYNKDMRKYKGKKTFTCHNMYGEGKGLQKIPSAINDYLFFRHINEYDHMIFVSEVLSDDFKKRGITAVKSTVVHPCLDDYPEVSDKESDFILVMSRLVATKGLCYLIDAMKKVDCKLIICGKGPEEKRLRTQIEKSGLQNKIEMRGFVSEEEKEALQRECKFTVIPSLRETFCLAAIEFMAYGKPIICSNVDGLPYTIKDGGILVEPRNPDALADAINGLLSDENLRRELGKKARAVSELYSTEKVVDNLLIVFDEVKRQNE